MSASASYRTCDLCRKRKTRCSTSSPAIGGLTSARCDVCTRVGVECTYLAGYRKPGRPRASTGVRRASETADTDIAEGVLSQPEEQPLPIATVNITDDWNPSQDILPTITSISPQAAYAPSSSSGFTPHHINGNFDRTGEFARYNAITITSSTLVDDVVPWTIVSNMIAIFLCDLHSLFPLIHKPSFSQALAQRKDRTDPIFAALVLGLVAYTLGKTPLTRLTGAGNYTRQELHWIQRRCHNASMAKVDRRYRSLSVNLIAVLMCGHHSAKSMGEQNQATATLAEACQLIHLLCLQADEEDQDHIARELKRRLFWHVFAVDTTEASAGHVIHMNAFEGYLPLPLVVDDELLTSHGVFQPAEGTRSMLAGFLACVQIFPCMADCIARHRSLRQRQRRELPLSEEETAQELAWVEQARQEADARMQALPSYLKDPTWDGTGDSDWRAVAGMHRANIWVTETSLKFTLLAYAEELDATGEIVEERARVERSVFQVLSSLPLEALAANGESMRGKIFRIILDILRGNNPAEVWISPMSDWCDLYSRVQFVQLVTTDLTSLFPSRPPSPHSM